MSCNDCNNNPCNPKDCGCTQVDCGCKYYIESLACIRHDGNDLGCIDVVKGDSLESILEKIHDVICNISGTDGLSAYDIAIENGFEGTVQEWLDSLQGEQGIQGEDGLVGRGVAVFVQNTEPNQTDFDTAYGTVDGFGVNGIAGSNTFKPGDIWIENC